MNFTNPVHVLATVVAAAVILVPIFQVLGRRRKKSSYEDFRFSAFQMIRMATKPVPKSHLKTAFGDSVTAEELSRFLLKMEAEHLIRRSRSYEGGGHTRFSISDHPDGKILRNQLFTSTPS